LTIDRNKITDLIYDSCALLDDERFDDYIALCTPDFTYRITAFSEEIRKPMEWMYQTRENLLELLKAVETHEVAVAHLRRVASMVRIGEAQNGIVPVRSTVSVYHTWYDGDTRLFAIGTYKDRITTDGDSPLLASREVMLDTRRLASGSHIPI
tara:strand:- start:11163 stop:11621 length:459 start_codon:yes stop_codon:yes gene_type:complete